MARSERARSAERAEPGLLRSAFVREAGGVGLLGIASFAALALWTYAPADPLWGADQVANRGGRLGVLVAARLFAGIPVPAHPVGFAVACIPVRARPRGRR